MNYTGGSSFPLWYQQLCNTIPYSLKFSKFKIFAVFAGCTLTTKILSREKVITCMYTYTCAISFVRGLLSARANYCC